MEQNHVFGFPPHTWSPRYKAFQMLSAPCTSGAGLWDSRGRAVRAGESTATRGRTHGPEHMPGSEPKLRKTVVKPWECASARVQLGSRRITPTKPSLQERRCRPAFTK